MRSASPEIGAAAIRARRELFAYENGFIDDPVYNGLQLDDRFFEVDLRDYEQYPQLRAELDELVAAYGEVLKEENEIDIHRLLSERYAFADHKLSQTQAARLKEMSPVDAKRAIQAHEALFETLTDLDARDIIDVNDFVDIFHNYSIVQSPAKLKMRMDRAIHGEVDDEVVRNQMAGKYFDEAIQTVEQQDYEGMMGQ